MHRRETIVKIHIVQKGDTLWEIAKKYGVNFEELKMLNSQLSNPDMIMPGMKIKVPTTGGIIKKEAPIMGTTKEVPKAEHSYVKEKPIAMPIKEIPKKEMPIKEVPKKEMPIKEIPKEKPYTPKMPAPIIPEIDINNYYTMNMTNVDVDVDIEEKMPAPVKPEPPKMHVEAPIQDVCPPIIPYQPYCYEVSPMMPGSGFPPGVCPPAPCEQTPMQQYEQMPMPGVAPAEYAKWEEESSSSHMHHHGKVAGAYQPFAGYPETDHIPQSYYQQPLVTYGQMPTEHGYVEKHSYQESSSDYTGHTGYHHAPMAMPYSAAPADDCGCGGPAIPQPGIYGEQGFSPQMGNYPYPEVQGGHMGMAPGAVNPQMGAYPYPEAQGGYMGVPQGFRPQMGAAPFPVHLMQLDPRMMGAPYPHGVMGNIPASMMEEEVYGQNAAQQEAFAANSQSSFLSETAPPVLGPGGNAPVYAPPFNGNFAQPPLMNPYGVGAVTPFGMPRYFEDESSDYGN